MSKLRIITISFLIGCNSNHISNISSTSIIDLDSSSSSSFGSSSESSNDSSSESSTTFDLVESSGFESTSTTDFDLKDSRVAAPSTPMRVGTRLPTTARPPRHDKSQIISIGS